MQNAHLRAGRKVFSGNGTYRTRVPAPPQPDFWAALRPTDSENIVAAKQRLESELVTGIRHFSALRRVVALEDAARTSREIAEFERTPAEDECQTVPGL